MIRLRQRMWMGVRYIVLLAFVVSLGWPASLVLAEPIASPAPVPASWITLTAQPGTADNFYKLDVSADGLYRLTYADLQAAGLPVDTLDPTTFQVFEQGAEIAIYVAGEGDGSFDPGDFILFYGRKIATQYSETNVYWLTYGVQAGRRMTSRDVTPAGAPALSTFPVTLHLEENNLYVGDLPKEGLADRWYWQRYYSTCTWVYDPNQGWICEPQIPVVNLSVDLPSLAPGPVNDWATLNPALRGSSGEFTVNPDHHVVFFANGQVIGEAAWDGLALLAPDNDQPVTGAGPYNWEGDPDANGNCVLTDAGGNYFFSGLSAGNYVVDIAPVNFYGGVLTDWEPSPRDVNQPTPPSQSNDLATDSDGALSTRDAGVTLADGQVFMELDFGFTSPITGVVPGITQTTTFVPDGSAAVGDRVWYDENGDGIQDPDEPGIENVLVCLYSDNGNGYYNGPIRFSQDILIQGSNVISFTVPQDSGASQDSGYVNWIELSYRSSFMAQNDELAFSVPDTGTWSATISNFASSVIWLMDVNDPQAPVLLTGSDVTPASNGGQAPLTGYSLTFQDTTAGSTDYWAAGEGALRTPAAIRLDRPSDLRNPANQADWVIVSHAAFLQRPITATVGPPAFPVPTVVNCPPYPQEQDTTYVECLSPPEQLARHRQEYNGFTTMVVDVEDVYDQFNGGVVHPEALHQFALYMRDHWANPAPRFLVLVGDGNYDPLNNLGNSPPVYIPPYLAPIDLIIGEVAAMNRIVSEWPSLDSTPQVPFMGLGVLPANTLEEAQVLVNKAISYDLTPVTDGWNMNVTYVADDKDIAGDFPAHMNDIADNPAYIPDAYIDNKIYYKVTHATVTAVKDAIIDAINNGTLFLNYSGHGSRNAWAGERLLEVSDIPRMSNADRLAIFVPMTCLEGQYVVPNFSSFAETVVRHEGGGAVASWSATGRGVSTGHQDMLEAFYEGIFTHNLIYLGDSTTYAKQALHDTGSIFQDLLDTFVILGDPATAVKIPQADLAVSVTADSPTWQPGQPLTLTVQVTNTGAMTGTNVSLDVSLPPEFVNWSWSAGPGVNLTSGTTWTLPDLEPGATATLVISGTIDANASAGQLLNFAATATTDAPESHQGNNTGAAEGTVSGSTASISGRAWVDSNTDGVYENGELPLRDVSILVRNSGGDVVANPSTAVDGTYSVTGLPADTYTVEASEVVGFVHVSPAVVTVSLADGDAATVNFTYGATTGVDLLAFTAQRQGDQVVIRWVTADEEGVFGFNLYRSQDAAQPGPRVNRELLAATGDGSYRYVDVEAGSGQLYYWLEVVGPGDSQFVGPIVVSAESSRPFRLFLPTVIR